MNLLTTKRQIAAAARRAVMEANGTWLTDEEYQERKDQRRAEEYRKARDKVFKVVCDNPGERLTFYKAECMALYPKMSESQVKRCIDILVEEKRVQVFKNIYEPA